MWPRSLIKRNFLTEEHLQLLKNIEWNTPDDGWDILTPQIVNGKFHDLKFRSLPEGTQSLMPSNVPTAKIYHCENCIYWFTAPMPDDSFLESYYDDHD